MSGRHPNPCRAPGNHPLWPIGGPRALYQMTAHTPPACLLRASDLSHINDLLGGEQRERDGRTIAPDRQLREGKAGVFVEHLTRRNIYR